jgi:SAM-dependent methyltransferase
VWDRKPALRAVYSDIYRHMLEKARPGPVLEIGGGSGNFKRYAPSSISTDIVFAPWLDAVCDAQRLPFADGSFANIVMVDVLHHIENPLHALREITRVLSPSGRFIMCEPGITPLSGIFYRLFNEEPVDMCANPLREGPIALDRDPFDSNQAIPTLLVGKFRDALARALPSLQLVDLTRFSFATYPLSGGFKSWSLMSAAIAAPLLKIEWSLRYLLGPLAAFRLLAVYQRQF